MDVTGTFGPFGHARSGTLGYGDVLYLLFGAGDQHSSLNDWTQINKVSGILNSILATPIQTYTNLVSSYTTTINTFTTAQSELIDDLQGYTSSQNWNAVTHNLVKDMITHRRWKH